MSVVPKSFIPVLTQFTEFSRKKIRVNLVGKDTASPGEISQILVPEGKIDLSTFSLGGFITTTTSSNFAVPPPIEQTIEQVMIEIGSVQLHPSFNFYGHTFGIYNNLQGSFAKSGVRQILNTQPVNATVSANATNRPFQINNWLGFLNDVKILLTDRLPPVRIYIRWSQPNVLACATGTTNANYSLSGLYATMDILKVSPIYDEMLSARMAEVPLQIPYHNYQVIPCATSTLNGSHRWSSTSDALEKVHLTFIPTTYQNASQVVDSTTWLSPAFNMGGTNMQQGFGSRVTINGNSFPDQAALAERGEILLQTLQTLNEDKDITSLPHPNINSLANFHEKFFVHSVSFTYDSDDEGKNRKCGLSALGQNLIGAFETTAYGAGNTSQSYIPLVILETKSVLEVANARQVRVIY
jgi:hypothetical protein